MQQDVQAPARGERRERLLTQLEARADEWTSQRLGVSLDELEREFLRLAEIAGDNTNQSRYWQAAKALERLRVRVAGSFAASIRNAFAAFRRGDAVCAPSDHPEGEALALVDDDNLERSIAIDNMGRRSGADNAEALHALGQRLSVLAGGRKLGQDGNPLAPAVMAEGLDRALSLVPTDHRAHLLALKFCQSPFMSHLPQLYAELNDTLKQQGVLPNLRYDLVKQPSQPERASGPDRDTGPGSDPDRERELLQQIRQLQQYLTAPPLEQGLIPVLAELQRTTAKRLTTATETDAIAAGIALQADKSALHLPDGHELIELVGLLFEYMLADEQLPDAVKALLSYLHTPYLKLALIDRTLVEQPRHPARILLNSLVAAGERWVAMEGKRNEVFARMKAVVQRVLDDFDSDPELFSSLNQEFIEFIRQHERRVTLAERRARETAAGEQRLRSAREYSERLVRQRTRDASLAPPLQQLLVDPWAGYLSFILLRHGRRGDLWRQAVRDVDEILWLAGSDPAAAEGKRATSLRERIRQGLRTIGFDEVAGEDLIAALPGCNRDQAATAAPRSSEPEERPATNADPLIAKLRSVEPGTWFLFDAQRPAREQRRLKLAWANGRTGHCMLVNALGQQSVTCDLEQLAQEVRSGSVRLLGKLDRRPFTERALERIATQLERRGQPAKP